MKALVVSLGLLVFVLLAPTSAHAKGIPLIYNTGDHAFATGPLPAPLDKDPELAGYEAGYLCQVKGVLWSYFSVSDCKPVAFKGDTYIDDAEVVKAVTAKYTEADMKRGLWEGYGWILLVLGVVAGLLIWLKEKIAGGSDSASEEADKAT
jgi:hypothetical protein